MDTLNLRIRFKDSLKITIKNTWLPIVLGLGLAAYQGNLDLNTIVFLAIFLILTIGVVISDNVVNPLLRIN